MDKLLLTLCFKSCLRGENDNEYYEALGLESKKDATPEVIKKQFKKKSLELHPDKLAQRGVEVTAEHKLQFQQVREAYEVLNDPKRKALYDELGITGMQLIENPSQVDYTVILKNYQRNSGDRTFLILFILLFFASLFLLPVLFCLKSDATVGRDVPWVALWSPMWLVDIISLLVALFVLCDDSGDDADADAENKGESSGGREADGDVGDDEEKEKEKAVKLSLFERVQNFVSTILFILIQIFILIRLDGYITWSWFLVFIPWFAYDALAAVLGVADAFFVSNPKPEYDSLHAKLAEAGEGGDEEIFMTKIAMESQFFENVMKQQAAQRSFLVKLLRIWLAVFLALKLDGMVTWTWGLVLLPIWVYLFVQYSNAVAYRLWANAKASNINVDAITTGTEQDPLAVVRFSQSGTLAASSLWMCFSQLLPLIMSVLLVARLEAGEFSTFIILLPIFLIIGCCCCVVCCGICTLSMVDPDEMDEEMRSGDHEQQASSGAAEAATDGKESSAKTPFIAEQQQQQQEASQESNSAASEVAQKNADADLELGKVAAPAEATTTGIDVDID